MNRTTAREISIALIFAASAASCSSEEMFERFFDEEHYKSLAQEDEIYSEYPDKSQLEYIRRVSSLQDYNRYDIDRLIEKYSKGWKLDRISKTALAILRCAVCEIMYMPEIPNSAAINEAVELAKGYDEPDTVAFINGVLGGFMRGEIEAAEKEQ